MSIYKLEDRVLFDAAAAADVAVAESQTQDVQDVQPNSQEAADSAESENSTVEDALSDFFLDSNQPVDADSNLSSDLHDYIDAFLAESNETDSLVSNPRVMIISNALENADELSDAASQSGTLAIRYDAENATVEQLIQEIDNILGGQKASSIAIAVEGDSDGNIDVLESDSDTAFWKHIPGLMAENGRIDFMGSNLGDSNYVDAVAELTGLDVTASDDVTGFAGDWILEKGDVNLNDLYFNGMVPDDVNFTVSEADDSHELVIINSSVLDAEKILDDLDSGTEILRLNADSDPLDQINEYLDNHDGEYDTIRILSHGNEGYFVLNGRIIDSDYVASHQADFAALGEHISEDGDIMLYGCNLAANAEGQDLVDTIAGLTGADVAASNDSTSNAGGGNWDLEYTSGIITAEVLTINDYNYVLTDVIVDSASDDGAGVTLREAIAGVGSSGGEVTFNIVGNDVVIVASELVITETITINGFNNATSNNVTVQVSRPGVTVSRVFNIDASGQTVNISNMTIQGGNVSSGGGIYNKGGNVNLDNVTISNSKAHLGGGIYNADTLTMTNSTVSGNEASSGGGIYNGYMSGTLTITNSTVSGNIASGFGGGIYNEDKTIITNSTVSGNTASDFGGGIFNDDVLTITNSTVSGNKTSTSSGGGIHNTDRLTITNSTIFGNEASISGGGIHNIGTFVMIDSTVSGNNASTSAGGIYNNHGTSSLVNNIIAYNYVGATHNDLVNNATVSGDYNIIGDQSFGAHSIGYNYNDNPSLFAEYTDVNGKSIPALKANGGFTETVALADNSIANGFGCQTGTYDGGTKYAYYDNSEWKDVVSGAIISGGVTSITTDQRDVTRALSVSIGAYQYNRLHYKTSGNSVDWNNKQSWTYSGDGITWFDLEGSGIDTPDAENSLSISIVNDINVNITVSIDQTIINSLVALTVDSSCTLTVVDGDGDDLVVTGELVNNGSIIVNNGVGFVYNGGDQTVAALAYNNLVLSGTDSTKTFADGTTTITQEIVISDTITLTGATGEGEASIVKVAVTGAEALVLAKADYTEEAWNNLSSDDKNTATFAKATNSRVFNIDADGKTVNIRNMTIQGGDISEFSGDTSCGGGILVDEGTVNLTDVTITGSKVENGGGIYVNSNTAILNVTGSTISNNSATLNGGGINVDFGTVNLSGWTTISGNRAKYGGGLYTYTSGAILNVTETTIFDNHATDNGGGINVGSGTVNLDADVEVSGNTANNGGGIYVYSNTAWLNVTGTTISGNNANYGGGIYVNSGTATLNAGTIISNNSATADGGGIYINLGTATLNSNVQVDSEIYIGNDATLELAAEATGVQLNNVKVYGTFTVNCTVSGATFDNDSTVTYLKEGNQNVAVLNYYGLAFASSGNKILAGHIGVAGDFTITDGTFVHDGNTVTYNGNLAQSILALNYNGLGLAGGDKTAVNVTAEALTMTGDVKLSLSGALFVTTFVAGTSTVEYAGGDQTIAALAYNNLALSGTNSTKTFADGITSVNHEIVINEAMTLTANSAHDVTVKVTKTWAEAGATATRSRAFHITGTGTGEVNFSNMTIKGGNIKDGDNTAGDNRGGGVYLEAGTANFTNVTISDSRGYHGGGILSAGTLSMTDCTISNNVAYSCGGGVYLRGSGATLIDCTISDNSSTSYHAGGIYIWNAGASLTISNSTISNNTATSGSGGAICNYMGSLIMSDCVLEENQGAWGGAIRNTTNASFRISNSTFFKNIATNNGGAISNGSLGFVENSSFIDNTVTGYGGAISNSNDLTLINCTVAGNSSTGNGGGIYNSSDFTLTNSTVAGNSSTGNGGGIYNSSDFTLINSTIVGNLVTGVGQGGGIYDSANLSMINSIVVYNYGNTTHNDVTGTIEGRYNIVGGRTIGEHSINYNYTGSPSLFDSYTTDTQGRLIPTLTNSSYALLAVDSIALSTGCRIGQYLDGGETKYAYKNDNGKWCNVSDSSLIAESVTIRSTTDQRGEYRSLTNADIGSVQQSQNYKTDSGTDTDWSDAANWLVQISDNVWEIASIGPDSFSGTISVGREIVINETISVDQTKIETSGHLEIAAGHILTINDGAGTDLTVAGSFTIAGVWTVTATATINLQDNSTVIYNGGTQLINELAFYNLTIDSTEATWTDGTSVKNILTINNKLISNSNLFYVENGVSTTDPKLGINKITMTGGSTLELTGTATLSGFTNTTFTAGTGQVAYTGGTQNVAALAYNELVLSGTDSTKTFADGITSVNHEIVISDDITLTGTTGEGEASTVKVAVTGAEALTLAKLDYTESEWNALSSYNKNAAIFAKATNSRVFNIDAAGKTVNISNMTIQGGDISNLDYTLYYGGSIYILAGTVNLDSVTVSESKATHAGGIYNNGTLTLTDSTITNNIAKNSGGGIYNRDVLILVDSIVSKNTAQAGGGINSINYLSLTNSTVKENSAGGAGGGLFSTNTLTLTDCHVTANTASNGAGVYNAGTLALHRSTVTKNIATTDGGGIYTNNSSITLNDSTISDNIATGSGGGFYSHYSVISLNDCTVSGNSTSHSGGGIYSDEKIILLNTFVENNTATNNGGGIFVSGNMSTLTNSTITGNTALSGGGIYCFNHTTLTNSTVANNTAESNGGGIYNKSNLTLDNSTVRNNTIVQATEVQGGGGIYTASSSTLTLRNSTVNDNIVNSTAVQGSLGGGILAAHNATLTLSDSTIFHNIVEGQGGGIYNASNMHMYNCTITANEAGVTTSPLSANGSGLVNAGTAVVHNSIIAANPMRYNSFDNDYVTSMLGVLTGSYNISGSGGLGTEQIDYSDGDSLFVVDGESKPLLADNGGKTLTVALSADSIANEAGSYTALVTETDQRGFYRTGSLSIGAFQGGNFRTQSDGNWNGTGIWEVQTGTDSWQTADFGPTNIEGTISINHNISLNADAAIDQATIATDKILTIAGGVTLTISNGLGTDLTVTGSIINNGVVTGNNIDVNYNGGNQIVYALNYNQLQISGEGSAKTFQDGTTSVEQQIQINDNITLNGSSSDNVTVQVTTPYENGVNANATQTRVFKVTAFGKTVNISNITIKGGDVSGLANIHDDMGGGILHSGGNLILTNVSIKGSKAGGGGGIYTSGNLTLNSVLFQGNQSTSTGGALYASGTNVINDGTVFYGNSADGFGGAIKNGGNLTINGENTLIGGLEAWQSNTGSVGGGIHSSGGTLTINGAMILGNRANIGGGLLAGDTLILNDVTVQGNDATSQGDGLYIMGDMQIEHPTASSKVEFKDNIYIASGTVSASDDAVVVIDAGINFTYQSYGGVQAIADLEYSTLILNVSSATGAKTATNIRANILKINTDTKLTITGELSTNTLNTWKATVEYAGDSTQMVTGLNYYNLTLGGTGAKTLAGDIGIAGDFTITTGIFAHGGYGVTYMGYNSQAIVDLNYKSLILENSDKTAVNINAETLTMIDDVKLSLTEDLTVSTFTAGNGTVEYTGANQTVVALNYHDLTFSGSGDKTLAGDIAIAGDFTITAGNFVHANHAVTYNGAAQTVATLNYSGLTFSGSGDKTLADDIAVAGDFTITAGTFVHDGHTVTYNGGDQTVAALNYSTLVLSGGTKTFADGTTSVEQQIELTDNITLTGSSAIDVIVQVTNPYENGTGTNVTQSRVFYISSSGNTVNISNMTIKGGDVSMDTTNDRGGAILVTRGDLHLNNVIVSGSKAYYGGGIGVEGGGTLTITGNSIIRDNFAIFGGGIHALGAVTLQGTQIINNIAQECGGGISMNEGFLDISDGVQIINNKAVDFNGGGIYLNDVAQLDIHGTESVISGNHAMGSGGGIYNDGDMVIRNAVIEGNHSKNGSAVYSDGNVTLDAVLVRDNVSNEAGGTAIYASSGIVTMTNGTIIAGNQMGEDTLGVGIGHEATLNIFKDAGKAAVIINDDIFVDGIFTVDSKDSVKLGDTNKFKYTRSDAQDIVELDYKTLILSFSNKFAHDIDAEFLLVEGDITLFVSGALNVGSFSTNFGTVNYNGGDQTIAALDYYHLVLSGTDSTKTFQDGITSVEQHIGIYDSITLTGSGSENVIVQVTNPYENGLNANATQARVFFIGGGTVNISNMTTKGGDISSDYDVGGGILVESGTVNLTDIVVTGSNAYFGGGIYVGMNATLNVDGNSHIKNNNAVAGGAIYSDGNININNSIIEGNCAEYGGGLFLYGTADISNSTIQDNIAEHGGGIDSYENLTITASGIKNNKAVGGVESSGGGIRVYSGNTTVAGDSIIQGNQAAFGGAIYMIDGTTILNNGTKIWGNSAFGDVNSSGGGLYVCAPATLEVNGVATEIGKIDAEKQNVAKFGGGIYSKGNLTINDATIQGNQAVYGGGIDSQGNTIISGAKILDNSASKHGGGIRMYSGSLLVTNGTIIQNNNAAFGGGILVWDGALTLQNGISVRGNSASSGADGIYIVNGSLSVEHSAGDLAVIIGNDMTIQGTFSVDTDAAIVLEDGTSVRYFGRDPQNIVDLSYKTLILKYGYKTASNISADTLTMIGDVNLSLMGTLSVDSFNAGTGTVEYNGDSGQNVAGFNYYNLILSGTDQKTLAGDIGVAGTFTAANETFAHGGHNVIYNGESQYVATLDYYGLTFDGSGTKTLQGNITVKGNWINNVTVDCASHTVTFNGVTQHVGGTNKTAFCNFVASTTGNTLILDQDITINGTLDLEQGVFDIRTYKLTLTQDVIGDITNLKITEGTVDYAGSTSQTLSELNYNNLILSNSNITIANDVNANALTMLNGAILQLTGELNVNSFSAGDGTVNYAGADQTISLLTYNTLKLSGSGTRTFLDGVTKVAEQIEINDSLTVIGESALPEATAKKAVVQVTTPGTNGTASRVFYIDATGETVNISNLTVKGGDISGLAGDDANGGGIYVENGIVNLEAVTVEGAKAYDGGGIYNNLGNITLNNSTVYGNYAVHNGGGIYNNTGELTLISATIAANRAEGQGAGIFNNAGTLKLTNTIVAYNHTANTPDDIVGDIDIESDYNIVGAQKVGSHSINYDYIDNDPLFETYNNVNGNVSPVLTDNGGATMTIALSSDSIAIGAGTTGDDIWDIDQRGVDRYTPPAVGAFGGETKPSPKGFFNLFLQDMYKIPQKNFEYEKWHKKPSGKEIEEIKFSEAYKSNICKDYYYEDAFENNTDDIFMDIDGFFNPEEHAEMQASHGVFKGDVEQALNSFLEEAI
jgi:fibronectin-binding autotransporter adhesin